MRTIEGMLRYDVLDTESWCFDMGYQTISASTGMAVQILMGDRFLRGELLETSDGGFSVVFNGNRQGRHGYYALEQHQRYPAKMEEETVERILDKYRLLEQQHANSNFGC